jgi:tetratricopeptide (TPR) repeat protein
MGENGKPLVFISHADEDSKMADQLAELVGRMCTGVEIWFSSDGRPGKGCTPGKSWFEDIHDHLAQADCLLALVTWNSINRPWVHWESGAVYLRLERSNVIPILVGPKLADLKPPLSELQGVDATNHDKLCSTLLNMAHGLKHGPREKDVSQFCTEFVKEIELLIPPRPESAEESVLSDTGLVSREYLDEVATRLMEEIRGTLGEVDTSRPLDPDQKITREPDPVIEKRARQALALEEAGIRLAPDVMRDLAYALSESGDAESALLLTQRLVSEGADAQAWDYNNLGALLEETGNKEGAEQAYRKAVDVEPTYATAWYNLGVLLNETGRKKEAEEAYCKTVEVDKEHAMAFNNLGVLLESTDRKEQAESSYRRAIEIDPKLAYAWSNLGTLLRRDGREEEGEAACRKAVETDPVNAEWHNDLAYYLWEMKRMDEAEREAQEAIRLGPNHSYAHATLGLIMFEKNELEEGRKLYEKAAFLSPDDLPLQQKFHFEYGRALGRNKQKDQARTELETAKAVDATFVPLADIEAELRKLDE